MEISIPIFPYSEETNKINNGGLHEPSPPPPSNQTIIEDLESSIQDIQSLSRTRRRWNCFPSVFGHSEPQGHDKKQEQADPDQNSIHVRAAWRTRIAEALESLPARIIVIALLLIDVTLTIFDLASLLTCDKEKEANKIFHWVGVGILSVLSAKILVLMLALGIRSFFSRPGNVFDGVVIIGALVLELLVERKGAGLIVVASLWRVVRVVETVMELGNESFHVRIERVVKKFEELKIKNKNLEDTLAEKNERIRQLEENT